MSSLSSSRPPRDSGGFDVEDLSSSPEERVVYRRHACADCSRVSPPTNTNFTLISAAHGWRLHRELDPATGSAVFTWRCPACWERFKARRAARGSSPPPSW